MNEIFATRECLPTFKVVHEIKFRTLIRGHHVYKDIWTPMKGWQLYAYHGRRGEALAYDKFAVGIYIEVSDTSESNSKFLVGIASVECRACYTISSMRMKITLLR